jgi:hypothetical protein
MTTPTLVDELPDTAEYPEYAPAPELADVDQAAAPEAPRGLTADGKPRRKPGPPKGSPARGGRAGRTRRTPAGGAGFPAPPKKAATAASSAPSKDYATGVMNLLAIPQGVLTGVGMLPGKDAFMADAAAVAMFAPSLAGAAAQFAADQPTHPFVRWIDRAITVGPYAMFSTAAVSFIAQLMVNHGALPAGLLGTASPKALAEQMRGHAAAAAAAQAGQG